MPTTWYCHNCACRPHSIAAQSRCTNVINGRQCNHSMCDYCYKDPNIQSRTKERRSRAEGRRRRFDPVRQHVDTSPLSNQSPRDSRVENPVLENQVITIPASATAQVPQTQPTPQHPWLPLSESPYWPYSEQYKKLQRSIALRLGRFLRLIRTCYVLIFLGVLTIIGSLIPAIWRSVTRNDIQGGFSLAQYILGVGVFVIGFIVAIHSRTCTCWQ